MGAVQKYILDNFEGVVTKATLWNYIMTIANEVTRKIF